MPIFRAFFAICENVCTFRFFLVFYVSLSNTAYYFSHFFVIRDKIILYFARPAASFSVPEGGVFHCGSKKPDGILLRPA